MVTGEQTLHIDMEVVVKGRREMFQQFVERVGPTGKIRSHKLTLGALTHLPQINVRVDISELMLFITFSGGCLTR